jgi:hypothetical protein
MELNVLKYNILMFDFSCLQCSEGNVAVGFRAKKLYWNFIYIWIQF